MKKASIFLLAVLIITIFTQCQEKDSVSETQLDAVEKAAEGRQ